ncbi:acyl-CoA dehydrogenase family protein [Iamia majanohamensis]|uniref:Acyl-CoA dehydrogenase family protein n=1 Tax=Iamia majanohamensis TaxID=467976 RepID=A0AAE9YCK8_9ACTN|nr:acyl-CoA dehydrogenase family protein [Iamia majanohamensis]WCO65321.1 acyl-CoA dehydrogenase family protein [Iamia majanohamensis]
MTDTAARPSSSEAYLDELQSFLDSEWDPDLTVAAWWEKLGTEGWSAPAWPTDAYGRGLSPADAVRVQRAIADHGALGAPGGLGLLLAGPTIATHGNDEQKKVWLREIVTGQKGWCQLFSEPGAGSDLAGLNSRAVRDGDEWVVNGQKVWTSAGHIADMGMLIARTDPDAPKHRGITYFGIEMHQPGIEVRPLKEMTGRALFNEVFLTDARVPADNVIGDYGQGWIVANTTLAFERAGLGAGGGSAAASAATPGTVVGDLDRRAGDFVTGAGRRRGGGGPGAMAGAYTLIVETARANGMLDDPIVRQGLMELYTANELARVGGQRLKAEKAAGRDLPGYGNLAKLSMSHILRLSRELGLRVLGPAGTIHSYDGEGRDALKAADLPELRSSITEMSLFSPGPPIYGGTDQVQRNIIGERVLGLPKEPGPGKDTPFSELPKNG